MFVYVCLCLFMFVYACVYVCLFVCLFVLFVLPFDILCIQILYISIHVIEEIKKEQNDCRFCNVKIHH